MVVLPEWLNQVDRVDFTAEKGLLTQLEALAESDGWGVNDGGTLPKELQRRTDVLFVSPDGEATIRLAVLQKSSKGAGTIRLDSSAFRTLELVYRRPKKNKRMWRVFAGGVPIEEISFDEEDNVKRRNWRRLTDLLLGP